MSSYGGNWATEKVEMEKLADGTMWINQSLVYFKKMYESRSKTEINKISGLEFRKLEIFTN